MGGLDVEGLLDFGVGSRKEVEQDDCRQDKVQRSVCSSFLVISY